MSDPEDADREVDTILLIKTGATLLLSKEDILTFWFVYKMITKITSLTVIGNVELQYFVVTSGLQLNLFPSG